MASSGPSAPGTTSGNNTFTGSTDWGNGTPNDANIKVSDSSYATCFMGSGTSSHGLTGTNYGFAVPTATGDGINTRWRRKGPPSGGTVGDNAVRIIKGGVVGSTDKSVAGAWSSTEGNFDYGGSADTWGLSWTNTDFNSSGFGCALSAKQIVGSSPTASVNYNEVTVYYTVSVAGGTGNFFLVLCMSITFPWRNWLLTRRSLPRLAHVMQSAQTRGLGGQRYLDPVASVLNGWTDAKRQFARIKPARLLVQVAA